MPLDYTPRSVAFFADYVPRQCGIATYTKDVRNAVAALGSEMDCPVVAVTDRPGEYDYPTEVRFEVEENDRDAYRRAAEFLNARNVDVVCIQHEFGIFGGSAGSYVLDFAQNLRMPVVTTLHTVLKEPNEEQRRVMDALAKVSSRLIVMSEKGKSFLTGIYGVPEDRIDVIPHGIPDMPFVDPNFYKDKFDVDGKRVLLTFGLLSPNKGIENVIRALPDIIEKYPDTVYMVLGATHPNLVRESGEVYRESLVALAEELGVAEHVRWFNQFVSLDDLKEFIGCADLYITPYLNPAQITSGTLAYSFGCGKAVISTPYWHAEELLSDGRGILVPFGDHAAIAREALELIDDAPRRHVMRKKAYALGRTMIWSEVAKNFRDSFRQAREEASQNALSRLPRRIKSATELPTLKYDHVRRLTDNIGIFEHARYSLPNYGEGYSTDDNARALIWTTWATKSRLGVRDLARLGDIYTAFLHHAFRPEDSRFNNCMSFEREWQERIGSDDSHGRSLWALGVTVNGDVRSDIRAWASQTFDRAMHPVLKFTSPRAWAFSLLGLAEYLARFPGDLAATRVRSELVAKLEARFADAADENWRWFEDILSYDNAVLPQSLIISGRAMGRPELVKLGEEALRWLMNVQRGSLDVFRPIGSDGFYPKHGECAFYDQQPLEAGMTTLACLDAYDVTRDEHWFIEAQRAFHWFHGANDLAVEMVDAETGGVYDGLHLDRVNRNQGSEALLAYLMARTKMEEVLEWRASRGVAAVRTRRETTSATTK